MKKVIFMGTPDFARTILEGLIQMKTIKVIAVVTQPDRPVGRKRRLTAPPVKQLAVENDIPVYQPEKLSGSSTVQTLIDLEPDLIITAAYGQYVPTKLLKAPPFKAINVHASLLPKYRGGAPIHYAIWQGEEETGISLIYMTKEMDAGAILAQVATPIGDREDVGDLFERLAILGRDLLIDSLPKLFAGELIEKQQDQNQVSFSPTISKEQEQIQWTQTALEIDRHVRAFRPFPTTYTWLDDQRVKIIEGFPSTEQTTTAHAPGTIIGATDDTLRIQAGEGTIYEIEYWQEAGKKAMAIKDFLNGANLEVLIGKQMMVK